jgi:hypothetical protein
VRTDGSIIAAAGVGTERVRTNRSITAAVGVGKERIKANGRVHDAGGEAEKRIVTLRRVAAGIAAIRRRWGQKRSTRGRKAKADQRDEKYWGSSF